jgi:hypothetical protein
MQTRTLLAWCLKRQSIQTDRNHRSILTHVIRGFCCVIATIELCTEILVTCLDSVELPASDYAPK